MEGMNSGATSYTCSGVAWSVRATNSGSWTAHILAGTGLLLWALHWNQAIFRGWLTQGRKQRPFRSHATYPVPFLPERWPVEALAKVVLSLVAILVTLVSSSGLRSNTCGEGTPREGHFDPENVYRYANVWVLFSVVVSGLVDLLGFVVELPEGTESFFTAAVFMLQSFLLVEQQYTDMLEDMVYYVMFLVSSGTAVFTLGEIVWPNSFMASCGRVYCTYMQAIWYFGAAHILHEGRIAWDSRHPLPDMAPAAFVPVPFVFLMNVCSLCMFLGWVVTKQVMGKQGYGLVSGSADAEATWATGNGHHKAKEDSAANELVPLVARI